MHSAAMKRYQMIENAQNPECFTSNRVDYPSPEILHAEWRTYWRETQRAPIVVLPLRGNITTRGKCLPVRRVQAAPPGASKARADQWTEEEHAALVELYSVCACLLEVQREMMKRGFRRRSVRSISVRASNHGIRRN